MQNKHLIGFYQKNCQMNAVPGNSTCRSSLQFLRKSFALSVLFLGQCLTASEAGGTHPGHCERVTAKPVNAVRVCWQYLWPLT